MNDKEKRSARTIFPVIGALLLLIGSVGYIIFKTTSNKAYNEKWKDYDECGLG